jgi:hypothetical protein
MLVHYGTDVFNCWDYSYVRHTLPKHPWRFFFCGSDQCLYTMELMCVIVGIIVLCGTHCQNMLASYKHILWFSTLTFWGVIFCYNHLITMILSSIMFCKTFMFDYHLDHSSKSVICISRCFVSSAFF